MVPYGALRLTNMNFFIGSVPERHQPVGLDAAVDQLPQAGDPETGRQYLVLDAAAQRGGDADHEVDLVLGRQCRPAVDDVPVVLRRLGQPGRVVHPVVIEEHALDLVPLGQRGDRELVGTVARLVGIGPFADEQTELHAISVRSGYGSTCSGWLASLASRRSGT